jgi:hypothetical protein
LTSATGDDGGSRWKLHCTANVVALMGQRTQTGTPLRLPTSTAHGTNASDTMAEGASRSRRRSNGPAIRVHTASKNPAMSAARPCSEGITLGMVSKRTQSRRRRAEKAEPLLRDHDGHGGGDIVVGARDQQPAQVEHRVDVAAAGVRHGHDVARRRRRLVGTHCYK